MRETLLGKVDRTVFSGLQSAWEVGDLAVDGGRAVFEVAIIGTKHLKDQAKGALDTAKKTAKEWDGEARAKAHEVVTSRVYNPLLSSLIRLESRLARQGAPDSQPLHSHPDAQVVPQRNQSAGRPR